MVLEGIHGRLVRLLQQLVVGKLVGDDHGRMQSSNGRPMIVIHLAEPVDLSQHAHRDDGLHVAQEQQVFGQVLDEELQQSIGTDPKGLGLPRRTAEELNVPVLQDDVRHSHHSLGAEEGFLKESTAILSFDDGLHQQHFEGHQRQQVDYKPTGQVPGPDRFAVGQAPSRHAPLGEKVEQNVGHEPDFAESDQRVLSELSIPNGLVGGIGMHE